jgi:hypothetical protein
MRRLVSRRVSWLYLLLVASLAVSGLMQMPIAKRYRIAEVPGLGWLGDFLLTHKLHYLAASGLLFLTSYLVTRWYLEWRQDWELTVLGWARAGVLAALIGTGAVRVLKNLPDISFTPTPTMLVDWTHLALAFVLGLVALSRPVLRASYIRKVPRR